MEMTFATAVRNASQAWSQNRVTDAATMAALQRHQSAAALQPVTSPAQLAVLQPELARHGQLGTRLNTYA